MDEYEATDEDKRLFIKNHLAENGPEKPLLAHFPSNAKGRKQFKEAQEVYAGEREEAEAEALQLFTDELEAFKRRRLEYHYRRSRYRGLLVNNPMFSESKLLKHCPNLKGVAQLFDDRQYEWKTTIQRAKDGSYHLKVRPERGLGLTVSGFTQQPVIVDFREPYMQGPPKAGTTQPRQHRIRNFTPEDLVEHKQVAQWDILVQINNLDVREDAYENGHRPGWSRSCLSACKDLFSSNRMLSVVVMRMNIFKPYGNRADAWFGYCESLNAAAELRHLVGQLLVMEADVQRWYNKHSVFAAQYMEELAGRLQAVTGPCSPLDSRFNPQYVERFNARQEELRAAGIIGPEAAAGGGGSGAGSSSSSSSSSSSAGGGGKEKSKGGIPESESEDDSDDEDYPEIERDPTIQYSADGLPRMCIPSDTPLQALRQELERLKQGILARSGKSLVPELFIIGKDTEADFKIETDGLEILGDEEAAAAVEAKKRAMVSDMVDLASSDEEEEEDNSKQSPAPAAKHSPRSMRGKAEKTGKSPAGRGTKSIAPSPSRRVAAASPRSRAAKAASKRSKPKLMRPATSSYSSSSSSSSPSSSRKVKALVAPTAASLHADGAGRAPYAGRGHSAPHGYATGTAGSAAIVAALPPTLPSAETLAVAASGSSSRSGAAPLQSSGFPYGAAPNGNAGVASGSFAGAKRPRATDGSLGISLQPSAKRQRQVGASGFVHIGTAARQLPGALSPGGIASAPKPKLRSAEEQAEMDMSQALQEAANIEREAAALGLS